ALPHVIDTHSPNLVALTWGVLSTWWFGLVLGIPLAIVARAGDAPQRTARDFVRPLLILLICTAFVSAIAGLVGFVLTRLGLADDLVELRLPEPRQANFVAVMFAHNAAYLAAAIGGIVMCVRTWERRRYERLLLG